MARPITIAARSRRVSRIAPGLRTSLSGLLWMVVFALLTPRAVGAEAPRTLELARLTGGLSLTPYLSSFVDPDGKTDLDQLLSTRLDADVKVSPHGEPSYGFTRDTVWLRFDAHNAANEARTFVLELAYPLLDPRIRR